MSRSAYSEISNLVDDLIKADISYEDLADALRRVTHDAALRMSSFSAEELETEDDEFENMPV